VIPNEGHTPTRTVTGTCARAVAAAFIAQGTAPQPCKVTADPFAPRGLVPGKAAALTAARLTVADAFDQLDAGSRLRTAAEPDVHGGGLRGGTFRGSKPGLVLNRYVFVKGFPVSGTVRRSGTVVLKVPGGVLRFAASGKVTGRLHGKKVKGRAALQRRSLAAKLGA
jgi:hypothetical protein